MPNSTNVTKGLGVTKYGQFNFGNTGENPSGWIQVLNRFQEDGLDYINDYEPQSQNLFFVGEFVEAGRSAQDYIRPFFNASYRIKSINIKSPTFSYKLNPFTKVPNLEEVNYPAEVTIDWMEDVYHSVQKYHMDWMSRWYNRHYDVLRCGLQGKFRRCLVIAFHYVNGRDINDYNLIEIPEVQPIFAIQIGGMCPTTMGDYKFDYSADANDQPISITYKTGRIAFFYNKDIAAPDSTRDNIWGAGIPSSSNFDQTQIWSPVNFEQDNGREIGNNQELEKLRITRANTSYIVDEGVM